LTFKSRSAFNQSPRRASEAKSANESSAFHRYRPMYLNLYNLSTITSHFLAQWHRYGIHVLDALACHRQFWTSNAIQALATTLHRIRLRHGLRYDITPVGIQ